METKRISRREFVKGAALAAAGLVAAACAPPPIPQEKRSGAILQKELEVICATPTPPLSPEDEALEQRAKELADIYSKHIELGTIGIDIIGTKEEPVYLPYVYDCVPDPSSFGCSLVPSLPHMPSSFFTTQIQTRKG